MRNKRNKEVLEKYKLAKSLLPVLKEEARARHGRNIRMNLRSVSAPERSLLRLRRTRR